MLRLGLTVIGILLCNSAHANYVTYQTWLTFDKVNRASYVAGAIDGTLDSLASSATRTHFGSCLAKSRATPASLADAIAEFTKDRPELNTSVMYDVVMLYLFKTCGLAPIY
jgi:hypothetical protein